MADSSAANVDDGSANPHSNSQDGNLPTPPPDPYFPPTSLNDSGLSKRPRDARLLHIVLSSYGVSAYQERVPLMLMDLAYRYTSSTLSDALHFSSEGYGHAGSGRSGGAGNTLSDITMPALRLSIHSRTHYQYNPRLNSTIYSELAQEKNKVALPGLRKDWGTMLPPEQYCLMGNSFEMEEDDNVEEEVDAGEDAEMKDGEKGEEEENEEVEGGVIQDVFGTDTAADEGDKMAD